MPPAEAIDRASTNPPAPGLTLLLTSPRVPAALLTRDAWSALEQAREIHARAADEPLVVAVTAAGLTVTPASQGGIPALARELLDRAAHAPVVWLGSGDGDPGLSDAIAAAVSVLDEPPAVEVLVGSWDVPGGRLLDVVTAMDRLRSPGGCPWDGEQTHDSLIPYLLEESQEAIEAIRAGDRDHLVEELGDVLLQVVFHARVGEEDPKAPFTIDDVAAVLVEKLIRRHPHVFADAEATTPAEVEAQWARIKEQERLARG
ncbi:MAG: MazG nucleotide pyrophosphohydrolase domain-containing protein [Tetrasphaera sp.]